MLVSITSKEFDFAGAMLIDARSHDFGETRRRSSRVATLDGGAAVNDFGYSDSDRTIMLSWIPTRDEDEAIRRLIRVHQYVRCSTPVGMFECIVDRFEVGRNGTALLSLLSVSTLSE